MNKYAEADLISLRTRGVTLYHFPPSLCNNLTNRRLSSSEKRLTLSFERNWLMLLHLKLYWNLIILCSLKAVIT